MKKILLLIILIPCFFSCNRQEKEPREEREMRQRFEGYLRGVKEKNVDSIQAYVYPKLFTLLSLRESRESMETAYRYLEENAELDSARVDSLYPISRMDNGSYSIAIFSMRVRSPLDTAKDEINQYPVDSNGTVHLTGKYPSPRNTLMAALIKSKYGIEVTDYNEVDGIRTMRIKMATIAAKDEYAKDWSFFPVTNDQELINKLFSQDVLKKLAAKE